MANHYQRRDVPLIGLKEGQRYRITFENDGGMPHGPSLEVVGDLKNETSLVIVLNGGTAFGDVAIPRTKVHAIWETSRQLEDVHEYVHGETRVY